MKTILLTSSILFVCTLIFFVFKRIVWSKPEIPIKPIKFEFINPVVLDDRIRVFNRWGAWLCDITDTEVKYLGMCNIGQKCEIIFIKENYQLIYKQYETTI